MRLFTLSLITVLLSLNISGCGSSKQSDPKPEKSSVQQSSPKTATKTKIVERPRTYVLQKTVKRKPPTSPTDFKRLAEENFLAGNLPQSLTYYQRELRRNPGNGRSRYNVGAVLLAMKRYPGAIKYLTDAIESGFTTKEAYHNLGLAYTGLGKTSAAKKAWLTARKRGVKSAEIETSLGLLAMDAGSFSAAEKYFTKAVSYDRGYDRAHNGLGLIALNEGKLKEAVEHWKRAERAERSLKKSSKTGFALRSFQGVTTGNRNLGVVIGPKLEDLSTELQSVLRLVDEKSFDQASRRLKALERAERKNPGYWNLLGYVEVQRGEVLAAEGAWQQAMASSGSRVSPDILINLALIEFGKRDINRAHEYIDRALESDSSSAEAYTLKGDLHYLELQKRKAEEAYRKAISFQPKYAVAINNLALLQVEKKNYSEAVNLLTNAVVFSDGDSKIRYNLALTQILAGNLDQAKKQLELVLEESRNDSSVYLNLGYVLGTQGDLAGALSNFEQALALNAESSMALNNIGVAYHKRGQEEYSVRYYQKAMNIDPNFAEASNNLGAAYLALGRRSDARESYEKAVELSAVDFESRRNLGHILLLEGKPIEAVEHLQYALALKPRDLDTLFDLALAYRKLGKRPESITFFETFIEFAEDDGSRSEQIIQAERALQRLRYP